LLDTRSLYNTGVLMMALTTDARDLKIDHAVLVRNDGPTPTPGICSRALPVTFDVPCIALLNMREYVGPRCPLVKEPKASSALPTAAREAPRGTGVTESIWHHCGVSVVDI
jgi:hypothetical protein